MLFLAALNIPADMLHHECMLSYTRMCSKLPINFSMLHRFFFFSKANVKRLQVTYNNAFRILLKLPRWTRAGYMFETNQP